MKQLKSEKYKSITLTHKTMELLQEATIEIAFYNLLEDEGSRCYHASLRGATKDLDPGIEVTEYYVLTFDHTKEAEEKHRAYTFESLEDCLDLIHELQMMIYKESNKPRYPQNLLQNIIKSGLDPAMKKRSFD